MFKRTAVLLAVLTVAVIFAAPIASDSDAATPEDIVITLPGTSSGGPVPIEVGSGGSETFTIYVYNSSDSYLSLLVEGAGGSDSVDVTVSQSTDMLLPDGISESGQVATVDVTVSIDRYDDSPSESAVVVLTFRDLEGASDAFTITVPVDVTVDSVFYSADGSNKFLGIFPNTFSGAMGSEWVTALVTLVAWIVISFVVCIVVIPIFARVFAGKGASDEKRRIRRNLTTLVVALIAVLAINQCLTILGASAEIRDGFDTLSGILYVVIGALIAWTVYVFIVSGVLRGVERGTDSSIDSSLIPLFKMIGKIVITVAAAAAILAMFGVDLTGILVSAGVITLGITLGAQNILNQFFSGIVLLSTRPFKKGDFVNIGGQVYIVRKVKLMFTEFDNWDKDQVVTIPNNIVSGGTIVNMTAEDDEARTYVYMTVAYGSDLKRAQELMVQAAMEHPHVIKDGSRSMPSTRLTNFLDSSIELRLAAYVDDFDSSGTYAGEMRERILQLFDENGIEIPYNKLDIVLEAPCDGRRRADDTTPEGQ